VISWVEGTANKFNINSEDGVLEQFHKLMDDIPVATLLNLLGTSLNEFKEQFKQLTSKQSINEDLLVNWFHILIAKLLIVSEGEIE